MQTPTQGQPIYIKYISREKFDASSPEQNFIYFVLESDDSLALYVGNKTLSSIVNSEGVVPVSKGGTGRTTLTQNFVLVGNNEDEVNLWDTIDLEQILPDIPSYTFEGIEGRAKLSQLPFGTTDFVLVGQGPSTDPKYIKLNFNLIDGLLPFDRINITQENLTGTINLGETEVIQDIENDIEDLQDDIGDIQEELDSLTLTDTINLGDTQVIQDIEEEIDQLQEDLDNHTHDASDIISGTLNIGQVPDIPFDKLTITQENLTDTINLDDTPVINDMGNMIGELQGDIADVEAEIDQLHGDVSGLQTDLDNLTFDDIDGEIDIDTQVPDIPFDKLIISQANLTGTINLGDTQVIHDIEDDLQDIRDNIDTIEADLDTHTHDASDITSGTLPVAHGGTGVSTLTKDYVLVGNNTSPIKTAPTIPIQAWAMGDIPTAEEVGARPEDWTPTWTEVGDKPTEFNPASHEHPFTEITGVAEVNQIPELPLNKIEDIDLVDVINITDITIAQDKVEGLTLALSDIDGDITALEGRVDQTETDIDNLDSKIDSEIESLNLNTIDGTLTVSKGGTGKTSFALDEVLVGNGAESIKTVPTTPISAWAMEPTLDPEDVPELPIDKITGLETKLEDLEDIAQANVQSDWAETDNTEDSYIKNKPEEINLVDIIEDIQYIQNLASDVSDNTASINTHTTQINTLNDELDALEGDLSSLDARVVSNTDNINIIDGEIVGINTTLLNKSDLDHKHESSDIIDAVNIAEVPLTTLEGLLPVSKGGTGRETLAQDYVLVGDGANQVKLVEQINLHNSQIELPQSQITNLETDLQALDSQVTTNTTNISNLTTRVGTNEDDIDDIQDELNNQINIDEVPIVKGMYDDNYFKGVQLDESDFKITFTRRDDTTKVIDLPLESVVVGGSYDIENKKIILTLQNDSTIEINVADLVTGLVSIPDTDKGEASNKTLGKTGTFKVLHISSSGTITEQTMTLNITANDVLGVNLEADKVLVGDENNKVKLVDQIPISAWAMKSSLEPAAVPILPISKIDNLEAQLSLKQDLIGYTPEDADNKKTSWSSTVNNTNYPSEKLVKDSLDSKVDKVANKGLSTNDFTTALKNRLNGIEENAQVNKIESISLDSEELTILNKNVSIPTTPIYAWALKQTLALADVPSLPISKITDLQGELDSLQTDIGKAVLTTTDQDVAGEKTFKDITTFEKGVIIPGQNSYIDLGRKDNWFWTRFSGENWTFNNTLLSGGWARNLMEMKPIEGDAYFRIGAQGSGQNFTQMYIGPAWDNYWLSLNNTRALFVTKPQYASDPTANNDLTRKYYVDTQLATKQATLVSGNNIKSFNNQTLLGSGAFTIATNKVLGRTSSGSPGAVEQIDLINIDSLDFAKADDIPTIPDIELNPTGTAGVITNITVDGTNTHKLNIARLSRSGIDSRTIFPTNWANVGNKPTNLTDYGITLTGDVSNTNNDITISNSAITTAKIANNAITNVKIQNSTIELTKLVNIGSQTVLGNATSSTGAVTVIPLINIDELDLVKPSDLSNYATTAELTSELAGKADKTHEHTTADITALTGLPTAATAGSILAADTLNVALRKLQTQINTKTSNIGTVTSVTLSGGTGISITNPTIIAAGTITVALSNMNANTIKGRISSNGAPQNLTAAQVRTILNVADGAEANVQSDWNATSGDAYIQNKPEEINLDDIVEVEPIQSTIVKRGTDGSASATSFKTGSAEIKYNNTTKSIDFIFS